ncbi:MAG: flagellin [Pseudomonadota bacterium]|mgnify:FL=1
MNNTLLTNNSAMVALETLRGINKDLAMVQAEISTGKSVANARDNAAVWAISTVMSTDVESFKQISDSLNKGSATVGVARNAAESVTDLITEMKTLVVSAQDDLNADDRAKIQADIAAKRDQITTIVGAAQFNGVNLVQGTADSTFLASLDRQSDGTVSTSNITVGRQDLSTDAGVFGTALGATPSAAFADVDASGTNSSTTDAATGKVLQFDITAVASETYSLTVNGTVLSYTTAASGDTADTIRDALAAQVNALGIEGLTVDASTTAELSLSNTNSFTDITALATADTITAFEAADNDGATPADGNALQTLAQRATSIDLSNTASFAEGQGLRVTLGGDSFTYVAGKNETAEDVARGLATAIASGSVDGVTAQVQYDATTEVWSLAVDDATGAQSLTVVANDGAGTASGGLFGLDQVDVSTAADAAAALDSIETLLGNSISAAAAFGSDQSRIESQSEFITSLSDSLKSGIGTLVDSDLEAASARLQALQVQQQLGTQALSIANQGSQSLLSLFR